MKMRARTLILFSILFLFTFSPSLAQNASGVVAWEKLIDGDIRAVAISPDGNRIAFRDPQAETLTVFDRQRNEIVWEVPSYPSSPGMDNEQATWSPDGSRIAWLSYRGELIIRDAATGARDELFETVLDNLRLTLGYVGQGERFLFTDAAWNHDGTQLAVMTSSYIIVFDVTNMRVMSVIDPLVINSTLHDNLSTFAWSPDGSTFAALHFRLEDGHEVFPLDVVMGFWNRDGRWLREYEASNSTDNRQNCIVNGQEIWHSRGPGSMGGVYAWSPDNRSLAVSNVFSYERPYSICARNPDGTLDVLPIAEVAPSFIHWSADQAWLDAFTVDCRLYRTDLKLQLTQIVPFGSPCHANSAAWSQDDRLVALGTTDGLWLGSLSRQ